MFDRGLRAGLHGLLGMMAMVLALPAPAHAVYSQGDAEALRKLDIMLMVSSLRCRFGADNFQADYQRFSARHLPVLNGAYHALHDQLARAHGARRATRMLDDISVSMANRYGQGHPWMDCRQLGEATRDLASRSSGDDLIARAHYLLAERPGSGAVFAAR